MSLIANLYGRLGGDPVARTTKSGKDMTTVQVAVDVTPRDAAAPETLWVGLLAFGAAAQTLQRAQKGQMVAALGRMTRGIYTPVDGEPRESWAMLCDSLVVTTSAKPTGGARSQGHGEPARDPVPPVESEPAPFYDDDIPF